MSTILVVDDDKALCELVELAFKFLGHKVVAAHTGDAALLLALETQPSLILMDLHLPGMKGWQAAESIRQEVSLRDIPIIGLTAATVHEETGSFKFDGLVNKPFRVQELQQLASHYLLPT